MKYCFDISVDRPTKVVSAVMLYSNELRVHFIDNYGENESAYHDEVLPPLTHTLTCASPPEH